MKREIVVASGNKGKLKEIKEMLKDYEVFGYKDFGLDFEIEENGNTFFENALIKAKAVAQALGKPALADDSGIVVEALGGQPGIYSARYAGDGDDAHNNQLLLKNMEGVEDRRAKFVCCMVYYTPDGNVVTASGETRGTIMQAPEGSNGFGYDCIFFSEDLQKGLGVASDQEKNSISHRSRALKALMEKLNG
ncbi:MAG: RdgB/HAM1 family non-canonical purine NTP pyrophosphatase [Clostridia bacterium]|nr:RdgB/HAM1 family non-canonical purine NTP pyrophosphatase [Clostridia bacterium]